MSTIEEAREQAREALANHAVNIMETDYWCDVVLAPALRALLDATEPPVIQYADSATVAGLAEKIAGENAELMDRLAVKPAEDEREALIERIAGTIAAPWLVLHGTTWGDLVQRSRDPYMRDAREVLRVVEAAGYSKGPRPITDEMVKAGARALNDAGWTYAGADEPGCWCEDCQAVCIPPARAILEAAEGARR